MSKNKCIYSYIHLLFSLCAEWLGRSEDPTKEVDLLPKSQNGVLSPRIWVAPQYLAQCVCPARSRCTEQHFLWHLWPGMVRDVDNLLLFANFCSWVPEHDERHHKSWTNIHHVPVFEVETTHTHSFLSELYLFLKNKNQDKSENKSWNTLRFSFPAARLIRRFAHKSTHKVNFLPESKEKLNLWNCQHGSEIKQRSMNTTSSFYAWTGTTLFVSQVLLTDSSFECSWDRCSVHASQIHLHSTGNSSSSSNIIWNCKNRCGTEVLRPEMKDLMGCN